MRKSKPTKPAELQGSRLQHVPQAGGWTRQSLKVKSVVVAATGLAVTGLGLVAPSNAPVPGDLDTLSNGCTMFGDAEDTKWEFSANQLKNRWKNIDEGPEDNPNIGLNAAVTTKVLLTATSDRKNGPHIDSKKNWLFFAGKGTDENNKVVNFSEGQTAEIDGYIAYVKPGGVESCNCKSQNPPYMDTHIYISPTLEHANPKDKQFCLIVEVTPRARIEQVQMGHDWATTTLVSTLKPGTHVRVSGYLFDDQEHRPNSVIDSPSAASLWRASCWEIHPVMDIQIVNAALPGLVGKK